MILTFSLSQQLSPIQVLCIFVICEQQSGSLSTWKPYIDVLPSTYSNPLHWSACEINLLPRCIRHKANNQVQSTKDSYTCLKAELLPKLELDNPLLKGVITWAKFAWAWSSVNTRCVYMVQRRSEHLNTAEEDHYALAPFLDLLNHSANVQVCGQRFPYGSMVVYCKML